MRTRRFILQLILLTCLLQTSANAAIQLAIEANPNPVRPGEPINVALNVVNDGDAPSGEITLHFHYPEHLAWTPESLVTTGGSANSVECDDGSSSTFCEPGEMVIWNLGNLPSGGGVTVTMPPEVLNVADGTLIQFEGEVRVDGVQQAQVSKTVQVQADPFFELALDEETDPVTSTGNREYTITYGNVGTSSSNTELVFPLPEGTSFVSATENGTASDGQITWDLGSLSGGQGGVQRVTVQINGDEGDLLEIDSVQISGTDSGFNPYMVHATKVSRVEDDPRPTVVMTLNPHPVSPGQQLNVELTVTNPTSTLISNVELLLRYPEHLDWTPESLVTTGGSANSVECDDGSSSTFCEPGEMVIWNLGNLPSGGGVTVTMPPEVLNVADGTLIQFEGEVRVDGVQQTQVSNTAFIGSTFSFGAYKKANSLFFPVKTKQGKVIILSF